MKLTTTTSSVAFPAPICSTSTSILMTALLFLGISSSVSKPVAMKDTYSLPPIMSDFGPPSRPAHRVAPVEDNLKSSSGMEAVPQKWTAITLEINDGTVTTVSLVKNGAGEEETRAAIDKSCRQAGVRDSHQTSVLTAKWMTAQLGFQRTQWWFESAGTKNVFQAFFGGMATVAHTHPVLALEMGSLEGASAMWFADNLLKHPSSTLFCLDTWNGGPDLENFDIDMPSVEERFKWNMAKVQNAERVTAIKGDSLLSLAGLVSKGLSSSFDAIYVDASHQMKDVLADGLLSFRLLKVGGVMIFDDYESFPGVAQAMTPLEEAFRGSLEVLFRNKHLVVRKTAEDRWATSDSIPIFGDPSRLEKFTRGNALSQE